MPQPRVFGMAGSHRRIVHLTGSIRRLYVHAPCLQLEDYGFCKKGEGGQYVSSGIIELGGKRPNNTNGGHLCEAYTHGMNMVSRTRGSYVARSMITAHSGRRASIPMTTPKGSVARCGMQKSR